MCPHTVGNWALPEGYTFIEDTRSVSARHAEGVMPFTPPKAVLRAGVLASSTHKNHSPAT